MTELEYRAQLEELKRRLDLENNVITDIKQIAGWDIVGLDRWKPGVIKYTAQRQTDGIHEQIIGFAKDEVFASFSIPP